MLEQIMLAEQQAGINLTGTESWHVEIMLSTRQRTDKPRQLQLTGTVPKRKSQRVKVFPLPLPLPTGQIEKDAFKIHFQILQN